MATIINNPDDSGSNVVWTIIGVVVLVVIGFLFFRYGLPAMQNSKQQDTNINVTIPAPSDNSEPTPTP